MNKSDYLLAAMPVPKAFLKPAVQALAAQLINILYNLVDKMFIGRIPEAGKQALAGVGIRGAACSAAIWGAESIPRVKKTFRPGVKSSC